MPRCCSALAQGARWEQRAVARSSPRTMPASECLHDSGPAQATAPPLCWSKPSRTPTESDRQPAARVCGRLVRAFTPGRIVVGGPMLAGSLSAPERCGEFLIRCVSFCRASSTMPKSAKVRL